MKKFVLLFVFASMIFGMHQADGMNVFGFLRQSTDRTTAQYWNNLNVLLQQQNYTDLAPLLKQHYDSENNGEVVAMREWVDARLAEKWDPMLLYMSARSLCTGPCYTDRYVEGLRRFMLCVVLICVAESVFRDSYTYSEPRQFWIFIKNRFGSKYKLNEVIKFVGEERSFSHVRSCVIAVLQNLYNGNNVLEKLPLPYWTKEMHCPHEDDVAMGFDGHKVLWGFYIHPSYLASSYYLFLTKERLHSWITKLNGCDSWAAFLNIKTPPGLTLRIRHRGY